MDEELLNIDALALARARARARERARQRAEAPDLYEEFPAEMTGTPVSVPTPVPVTRAVTRPAAATAPVTRPTGEASLAQQIAGGMGVTLGPLFRTLVGGMAAAGSPGQRPDMGTTARERLTQAERAVLAGERAMGEAAPLTTMGLGFAGAIPRYGLASMVPGGVAGLAATEAAVSLPEESLAGLAGMGARAIGQEELARRAESIAQNPLGRVASDFLLGETLALPFRAARAIRARRAAAAPAPRPAVPMTAPVEGPGIPMPGIGRTGRPEGFRTGALSVPALPSGARLEPETDPARLLASIAESLQGQRTSPFEAGPMLGPAIPSGQPTVPFISREYQNPIGPELVENPDITALRTRLMEALMSPPSETYFRNPETGRMATMGGGAATRRGEDVPFIAASGGEGRRMVVPKQNRPGEVVAAVQARMNRLLGDLLEGRTNIEGSPMGVEASPAFLANTPLRTMGSEVAAPLSPALRQTPETIQQFGTDIRPAPENLFPPPAVTPGVPLPPPTVTTTRLDPGAFPYLVNRRAGGRGFRILPQIGEVDPTMGGQFVFDRPLSGRVPVTGEVLGEGTRGPRRAAMAENADYGTPELENQFDAPDVMGDALDFLRNREGFITPGMLSALARTGAGGAAGGTLGFVAGETPEERRRLALLGMLTGAGVGGTSSFFARQAAQNRRINEALSEVERAARRRPGASPTATPFSSTGAPPGIERQTITGAPGVAAASPTPMPRTAGEPIARPTTVRPKDEPRLQRLNLTREMQDIYGPRIRAISEEIATTGKQTWDDLKDEAARLLNVRREELANIDPKRMTGAEGLAIASLVRENTEAMARLAGDFDAAKLAGRTDEVDRLTGLINDIEAQTNELVQVFMKGTSAQGRALQANRVLANLNSDPTYWIVKGQRIKGSDVLTTDQRNRIIDLANAGPGKREELLKYLTSLRRTGVVGQVAQLRRGGLLTGLTGRIYDVLGTGINLAEIFTRPMAAGIDRLAAAVAAKRVGGTAAQQRSLLAATPAEFGAVVKSLPEGIRRAAVSLGYGTLSNPREWSKFIREAELDAATLARYDIPQGINITMFGTSRPGEALNTVADTYQKFVMRLSGATDKLYRTMIYNGAMQEQARLAATREGLTGSARDARVQALLAAPTDAMRANAMYQSELLTFTNEGALATAIGRGIEGFATGMEKAKIPGLGAKAGELTRGLFNILIPFRRTPSNILTRVAEYTPGLGWGITAKRIQNWWGDLATLAAASKVSGADVTEETARAMASQRKLVQSLTRNVSGLGIMGLGAWMYDQDILTGDQPRDPSEAERWRTEGRMPNAVMLPGGSWVSVSRLAPLGTLLAVAANYRQQQESGTPRTFAGSALTTVLDQPMLTGPKEAIEALTGPDEYKREGFLGSMAGSFVPSAIASAARASGEQRTPETMGEAIRARIPGLEESIPVRRNIFGEPLERARGYFMPTMRDQRRLDPLVAEISRVRANVPAMDRRTNETPEMFDRRTQEAGRQVRAAMERMVASGRYRRAKPEDQKEMLEDAARNARREFSRKTKRRYNIESP